MASLGRINVTPVKGTALQHPTSVDLIPIGIAGNRRFHLVDERGRLYSGLGHGPLVRVACEVEGGALRCRFPNGRTVVVPTHEVGEVEETDFDGRAVPGRPLVGEISEVFSDYVGDTRTLDVHIKRLRSRIEEDASHPLLITTVRGVGYRYERSAP